MAKDPAFLFYSAEFLAGVSDLTMEERGQYITLLAMQHQKGHVSSRSLTICLPDASSYVLSKFEVDEEGNYFNQKLRDVISARQKHLPKKKAAATLGGLLSANQATKEERAKIKAEFVIEDFTKYPEEEMKQKLTKWFKHLLNYIRNGNGNGNRNRSRKEDKDNLSIGNVKEDKREVIFPYTSDKFMSTWGLWKEFRVKDLRCKPYAPIGEQAALRKVTKVSSSETEAISVIEQSMENGWRGLFEIKETKLKKPKYGIELLDSQTYA